MSTARCFIAISKLTCLTDKLYNNPLNFLASVNGYTILMVDHTKFCNNVSDLYQRISLLRVPFSSELQTQGPGLGPKGEDLWGLKLSSLLQNSDEWISPQDSDLKNFPWIIMVVTESLFIWGPVQNLWDQRQHSWAGGVGARDPEPFTMWVGLLAYPTEKTRANTQGLLW